MKGRSSSSAAPHSRGLDVLTALTGSVRRTIAHFRYQRVSLAQATDVVVLFTPDEARLREDLQGADEPDCERDLSPQAPQRPLRGRNGAWRASRPNSAGGTGSTPAVQRRLRADTSGSTGPTRPSAILGGGSVLRAARSMTGATTGLRRNASRSRNRYHRPSRRRSSYSRIRERRGTARVSQLELGVGGRDPRTRGPPHRAGFARTARHPVCAARANRKSPPRR
jgi:hypothetical protein